MHRKGVKIDISKYYKYSMTSPNITLLLGMEIVYDLPVFWNFWFQFLLQYDFYVSVLPNVRRELVPRSHCRLCGYVFVRKLFNDILRAVRKSSVFR